MKKILIVTDAWKPQVNGVVTTMTTVVDKLEEKGFHVDVIHPGLFHTFPLPNYPEISVAWNFWDLKKKIQKDGMMRELRQRQYYEKPTLKRQRKLKESLRRVAKENRLREKYL